MCCHGFLSRCIRLADDSSRLHRRGMMTRHQHQHRRHQLQRYKQTEADTRLDTSDSDFGVRRLVAALPFSHGIFGNLRGETVNIPFQFQVKSAGQTNVVPRAKLFEKESGDESPHSKGRLFRCPAKWLEHSRIHQETLSSLGQHGDNCEI